MPDPNKSTISATEAPALFGVSPYLTRWMLYQKFANGVDISPAKNERMNWGLLMQPLVLKQASTDLKLAVIVNDEDTYVRNGLFGCTVDAVINCPDRGPGALETKCVFDYGTWMREWEGGKSVPRHYEIQLQVQMYVGDGERPFQWGTIAAWVGGEMHYFERQPILNLWDEMHAEAKRFFDDVENGREPNAFGEPIEWPLMKELFSVPSGNTLDLRDTENADVIADDVRAFVSNKAAASFHNKEIERLKAELMAKMNGADAMLLPGGVTVELKRSARKGYTVYPTTTVTLKTYVPDGLSESGIIKNTSDKDLWIAPELMGG